MKNFYDCMVDITADLAIADVNVVTKVQAKDNGKYNFIPTAVMITQNSAADAVEALDCKLRGAGRMILYLKINEVYNLAVEEVFQSGSSSESIVLLGVIK